MITNKNNYPEYIEAWLRSDDGRHTPGTLSATQLIRPIRMIILYQRHPDQLELDIDGIIDAKIGEAWHSAIEKCATDNYIHELPLSHTFQIGDEKIKLTGILDILRKPINPDNLYRLADLKSTGTYSYQKGDRSNEYIIQLSIYRFLLARDKQMHTEDDADITFWLKDWHKSDTRRPGYPQTKIVTKTIPLWSIEQTDAWLTDRLTQVIEAQEMDDNILPTCSNAELWINQKTGKVNRCDYCAARTVCNQYRALRAAGRVS